ncbi:MAG: hypothetical protein L6R43_15140, partial [Planctomycetes bacterium]|nr:hypothetical protein [Planctomycetota bacterium]
LALLAGGAMVLGAEDGLGGRVRGYFDPVPVARAGEARPVAAALRGASPSPTPAAEAAWRGRDREGWRAFEAGDFAAAAAAWDEASAKAPPSASLPLHARADRARLYRILADAGAPAPGDPAPDPAASEAEYRRLLDSLPADDAAAWLRVSDFAASRGLRHHLAFLYDQVYERRQGPGGEALGKRVAAILRRGGPAGAPTPPEVYETVIRELPSSEAADIARERTGAGIGGTHRRGESAGVGVDPARLEEARNLVVKGDAEYRQAVPGSKDVNVHRRRALDLYEKARGIYQELDANRGTYARPIQELNRNIAELHKDLPIGR